MMCFDHKNKENIALKIIKNRKKLHKQGKIEIKLLELLKADDINNQKHIVVIQDSFTFRSHVVSSMHAILTLFIVHQLRVAQYQLVLVHQEQRVQRIFSGTRQKIRNANCDGSFILA